KERRSNHVIFGTMLICGALGLIAAFLLSVERVEQLINPNSQLFCDVNAIFNCSTVMQTWQAKVFGFPNSFIGLMAYPVVITLAVAGLAGVKFPRWFMATAQTFFGLGLLFAYWLFFQSVYVIQVLCPLCLVVTTVTTLLFEALLRYNLRENNLFLPANIHKNILGLLKKDYDKLLVGAWLAIMFAIVLIQFPGIYS
ncbi:MAG TPA: vitamin K epoxide reductase family protein, partial [Magnetospirillaceae bacterium]|nr:vitamin K epoxide reductase family protein [Magnetospirillaceae bacterium]